LQFIHKQVDDIVYHRIILTSHFGAVRDSCATDSVVSLRRYLSRTSRTVTVINQSQRNRCPWRHNYWYWLLL